MFDNDDTLDFEPGRAKRAVEYIRKDLVQELTETEPQHWQALVDGSETYEVSLAIDDNEIIDAVCTCPDDQMQYCKHIIAVYYSITNPELAGEVKETPKRQQPKSAITSKVRKLPKNQAQELLLTLRSRFPEVKEYLETHLLNPSPLDTQNVKTILNIALTRAKRKGYFDREAAHTWHEALDTVVKAAELMTASQPLEALQTYATIYDVALRNAERIDDSNGEFNFAIEHVFMQYDNLVAAHATTQLQPKILQHLVSLAKKYAGDGWYSSWELLRFAPQLIQTTAEEQLVLATIQECLAADTHNGIGLYSANNAARLQLTIIDRHGDTAATAQFVQENSTYPTVREAYVDILMNNEQFSQAQKICEDSLEQDKEYPGLVTRWIETLQIIASKTHDSTLLARTALSLFESKGDIDQLQLLKSLFKPSKWPAEYERLVTRQQRAGSLYRLRDLYVFGSQTERLLATLQNADLRELEGYHKLLARSHPGELGTLYLNGVVRSLKQATTRSDYQHYCRYLRRAKKLGLGAQVTEAVQKLIATYPQRHAMIDELHNV